MPYFFSGLKKCKSGINSYQYLITSNVLKKIRKKNLVVSLPFISLLFSSFLSSWYNYIHFKKNSPGLSFPFPSPSVSPLLPPVFLSGLHLVDDKGPVQSPYQSPSVFLCLPVILWSQYTSIHDPPDASCSQSPWLRRVSGTVTASRCFDGG